MGLDSLCRGHSPCTFLGPQGLDQGCLTLQEDTGLRLCVWDLVAKVCSWDLLTLYTVCGLNGRHPWHQPPFATPCVTTQDLPPLPRLTHVGVLLVPVCERPQFCSLWFLPAGQCGQNGEPGNKRTDRPTAGQQGTVLGMTVAYTWQHLPVLAVWLGASAVTSRSLSFLPYKEEAIQTSTVYCCMI